jgi:hypothetical protein
VLANETVQTRVVAPGRKAVRQVVAKTSDFLASERGQALRTKATNAVKTTKDLSAKIINNLDNAASRAVGASLDVAGHVHDAATHAVVFERKAATYLKHAWKSPPTRSDIHSSAVSLANLVDSLVERTLPEEEAPAAGSDVAEEAPGNPVAEEATVKEETTDAPTAQGDTEPELCETTTEQDAKTEEVAASPSISDLARNIAGKVSFRMKKRVVRKLEEAKGHIKLRTDSLLHSTNLIQYAKRIVADERYAKLSDVLHEASNVAKSSGEVVVRTIAEKLNNATVSSGVELIQKGEKTARLAIVTTGKLSKKVRAYSNELAAQIRKVIKEREAVRTGASPAPATASQEDAFSAAISKYVRAAADTGVATLFVFRGELGQVLTYAYTAGQDLASKAPGQVQQLNTLVQPAWTAMTQLSAKQAELRAAFKDAAKQSRQAIQQATTRTSVAFSEFATEGHLPEALPASFASGLRFILQRMMQQAQPIEEEVADAATTDAATIDAATTANKDASSESAEGGDAAETMETMETPVFTDPVPTVELDDEQSNAEWYYSVGDLEISPGDEDSEDEIPFAVEDAGC